jgi:hypothetical protein
MKTKFSVLCALILTAVLALSGCEAEDRGGEDLGENLLSEASILAGTWAPGETTVTKTGEGKYRVSGKIAADPDYAGIYCLRLNIKADPANANKYFARANRLIITIEFPDGAVRPNTVYQDGFVLYLENTKATANSALGDGSWQSAPIEEYNAVGGVGVMTSDRILAEGVNTITGKNNVGDYHQLVISVRFPIQHNGKDYHFDISNIGIYGDKIDDTYPSSSLETPKIHEYSRLTDAAYHVGEEATALRIVPAFQSLPDMREYYTYEWYSNTSNTTTGGTRIPDEQIGNNDDHPLGWNYGTSFIPPTGTAGTFYYYVIMSYEGRSVTSRVVIITVE